MRSSTGEPTRTWYASCCCSPWITRRSIPGTISCFGDPSSVTLRASCETMNSKGMDDSINAPNDPTEAESTRDRGNQPKSIILFSDGTGNSSAKLFKTNVWRMYEAVDLGPSSEGKRDQIAYYD